MAALDSLRIDQVIVHDVPRRLVGRGGGGPTLSDVPSPVDEDLRSYFTARLTETMERAAVAVEHDRETSSPVPAALVALFRKPTEFVVSSHVLATHLSNSQTGSNPGGLLVVATARIGGERATAVLKLEREEALLMNRKHVAGGLTFDMEHLRDLMLGNRTRVFKAGVFASVDEVGALRGSVSDTQGGYGREGEVAHFFLSTFLGCRLTEDPSVTTRRFMDLVEEFINERVSDPATKAKYRIATIAQLQDRAPRLSTRAFAANHLDRPDEQRFLDLARERGFARGLFDKDLRLIRGRVDRMALQFANGLQIAGSAQSFEESVTVEEQVDGVAHVRVQGRLSRVK